MGNLDGIAAFITQVAQNKKRRRQEDMMAEKYRIDSANELKKMAREESQEKRLAKQFEAQQAAQDELMAFLAGEGGAPPAPAPAAAPSTRFSDNFNASGAGATGGGVSKMLSGEIPIAEPQQPNRGGGGIFENMNPKQAVRLEMLAKRAGLDFNALAGQKAAFDQSKTDWKPWGDGMMRQIDAQGRFIGEPVQVPQTWQEVDENGNTITRSGMRPSQVVSGRPNLQFQKRTLPNQGSEIVPVNPVTGAPQGAAIPGDAPAPKTRENSMGLAMTEIAIPAIERMMKFTMDAGDGGITGAAWTAAKSKVWGTDAKQAYTDYESALESYVRPNSGAAIPDSEWPKFKAQIMPQATDDWSTKMLKLAKAKTIMEVFRSNMDPSTPQADRTGFAYRIAHASSYEEVAKIAKETAAKYGVTDIAAPAAQAPAAGAPVKEYTIE